MAVSAAPSLNMNRFERALELPASIKQIRNFPICRQICRGKHSANKVSFKIVRVLISSSFFLIILVIFLKYENIFEVLYIKYYVAQQTKLKRI